MAIYYCAGFDLATPALSSFSMVLTKDGESNITIDAAAIMAESTQSKMFLRGVAGANVRPHDAWEATEDAWTEWATMTFCEALEAALNTAATAWGVTFAVSLIQVDGASTDNPKIMMAITTGAGGLAYIDSVSAAARWITGYTAACGPLENGGTTHAQYQSHYILVPNGLLPPNEVSDIYELDTMSSQAVPESGSEVYGMSRTRPICCYDFTLSYQPHANTWSDVTATDYEYDSGADVLFNHCRASTPFVAVWDSTDDDGTMHLLRDEASAYHPKPVHPDYDDFWNIEFKTIYLGKVQLDG